MNRTYLPSDEMTMTAEQPQSSTRKSQLIAWQGWCLDVAPDWNPVKVEGDYDDGSLLIADMHAAKLGLRWKRAARKGDAAKWADRAMRAEVGKLAADEATSLEMADADAWRVSRLYIEPDPPGRDVWLGWSETSGRVLEVVYHAKKRDDVLRGDLLSGLCDTPREAEKAWSIFDLSVRTPARLALQWYKLNAGDLSLAFSEKRGKGITIVRQLGPATLALGRQKLDDWMSQHRLAMKKLYRPMSAAEPTTLDIGGREVQGLRATLRRKRRMFWAWMVAKEVVLLGAHDVARNRVVIGQGEDEKTLRELIGTIGWAKA